MLYKTRDVDFRHNDFRGSLTQLVHEGYKQINVLITKEGADRGAHFHKVATEAFFLITGSVKVDFVGKEEKQIVEFGKNDFFEIQPMVLHDMHFTEDCIMVQMYDIPVENPDGSKDIYMEDEFYA